MKLIFIRHAEPDYDRDALTGKGRREARILAKRVAGWKVTDFYCSPLGRARATAEPALRASGGEAIVCDWLKEFTVPLYETGKHMVLWDLLPGYLDENQVLFDRENWMNASYMQRGPVAEYYERITGGMDDLLKQYGYCRHGFYYETPGEHPASDAYMVYDGHTIEHMKAAQTKETVLVFFCHLGVMLAILSHLIHCAPSTLWQGIFVPPASVSVLSAEEREPGKAYFRCQMIGDTSHLRAAGEPVSYYGGFDAPFQG